MMTVWGLGEQYNQNCSVLYCERQLCTKIRTAHTRGQLLNLHVGLGLDIVVCVCFVLPFCIFVLA